MSSMRNTYVSYGSVSKVLHWTMASLIIFMLILGSCLGFLENSAWQSFFFTLHKSIGLTILFITIPWLVWRWLNPVPALPMLTPLWQKAAARSVHQLFYLLIIAMAFAGWAMSTAAGRPVNFWWLGHINTPFIHKSKAVAGLFWQVHYILAWTIFSFAVVHALAALKHHFIDRDDVLRSMWFSRG